MKTSYQNIATHLLNTITYPKEKLVGFEDDLLKSYHDYKQSGHVTQWRNQNSSCVGEACWGLSKSWVDQHLLQIWGNISQILILLKYEHTNTSSCSFAVVEMLNFMEMFTLLYNMWWPSDIFREASLQCYPGSYATLVAVNMTDSKS